MHENFTVRNVKCGGCVKAIQQGLQALPGVDQVDVVIDGGKVSVTGPALDRAQLAAKLSELGYPEAG
ncbi:MAG: heavy-metal-associated domain-containing protein [Thauera sp.]|nr:heavy-metal-associated domain-containing protein [Thauera sp.]